MITWTDGTTTVTVESADFQTALDILRYGVMPIVEEKAPPTFEEAWKSGAVLSHGDLAEQGAHSTRPEPIVRAATDEGVCPDCAHDIEVGDMVQYQRGKPVVHEACDLAGFEPAEDELMTTLRNALQQEVDELRERNTRWSTITASTVDALRIERDEALAALADLQKARPRPQYETPRWQSADDREDRPNQVDVRPASWPRPY